MSRDNHPVIPFDCRCKDEYKEFEVRDDPIKKDSDKHMTNVKIFKGMEENVVEVYCWWRLALEDLFWVKGVTKATNKLAIVKATVSGVAESYICAAREAEIVSIIMLLEQLRSILNSIARHFSPKHAIALQTMWFRQHLKKSEMLPYLHFVSWVLELNKYVQLSQQITETEWEERCPWQKK